MPYSFADIAAAEVTDAAADRPLLVATSIIDSAQDNSGFDVRWNADGDLATADDVNATFPTTRAYDRFHTLTTRPTTSADENWLLFKSGTSVKFTDFDTLFLLGHNIGANTATITARISDGADMTAAGNKTVEIATFSPSAASGNKEARLVDISLGHSQLNSFAFDNGSGSFTAGEEITAAGGKAGNVVSVDNGATGTIEYVLTGNEFANNDAITGGDSAATADVNGSVTTDVVAASGATAQTYTDVQFLGLRITAAGAFIAQISEVWLGRRRQLSNRALMGYNPDAQASNATDHTSESGVKTRFGRHRGRAIPTASYQTKTAAQATTVTTFFAEIDDGNKSFIWIERPNSAPTVAHVTWIPPLMPGGAHFSSVNRRWVFDMDEQSTFVKREG